MKNYLLTIATIGKDKSSQTHIINMEGSNRRIAINKSMSNFESNGFGFKDQKGTTVVLTCKRV